MMTEEDEELSKRATDESRVPIETVPAHQTTKVSLSAMYTLIRNFIFLGGGHLQLILLTVHAVKEQDGNIYTLCMLCKLK